jgi:hypothetical protein
LKATRGQGATEMMIILGVALAIFLVFLRVDTDILSSAEGQLDRSKAQSAVDKMANSAMYVYQQGLGSRVEFPIVIPPNVNTFSISNKTILINFTGTKNQVFRGLSFTVNGTLPKEPGTYFVTAEAFNNSVDFYLSDSVPPSSVTNLLNASAGVTWIYWTWTAPADTDFSKAIVFLDSVEKTTTPNAFYNATGLQSNSSYTLTVHTKDSSGNINNTDVNLTASTIPPTGLTSTNVLIPAQVCDAEDDSDVGEFGDTCDGQYPQACGDGDDLIGCDDDFEETHTGSRVGKVFSYGGLRVQSYNTSITNCETITDVELCYEWWRSGNAQDCDVSIDADGGSSYTAISTDCPGTSAPGVTCTNVNDSETWVCGNFFGASGTRAHIKSEAQRSGGPGTSTFTWDVLYYNVTYLRN